MFKPFLLLSAFTLSVSAMELSELTKDDRRIISKIRYRIHDEFSHKQLTHENKFGTETKVKLTRAFLHNKEKNLDYITCINKYECAVEKEVTAMLTEIINEYRTFTYSHPEHTHSLFAQFLHYDDFVQNLIHEFKSKYIRPVRIAHEKIRKAHALNLKNTPCLVTDDCLTMTLETDNTDAATDDMMEVEI